MSKVAWDYVVPFKLPADIAKATPGALPEAVLVKVSWSIDKKQYEAKLHHRAADAWNAMVAAAKADGVEIRPTSEGDLYRTIALQRAGFLQRYQPQRVHGVIPSGSEPGTKPRTYEGKQWYMRKGTAPLAVPGTSKHNLGIAVDVQVFVDPQIMIWLIANVKKFGWSWEVVPEEPWHIRYVDGDKVPAAVTAWLSGQPATVQVVETIEIVPAGGGVHIVQGDKGPLVKKMQELLVWKGYPVTIDGDFGPATAKALNKFKKSKLLHEDGICNQRTWKLLQL